METMKVIDLLNKIANGEEVPEKIKYVGIDFSFQHNCSEYLNDYGTCLIKNISSKSLNNEVEIIEDRPKKDKKIEKLDLEDDGNTITLFGEKENEWTILDNVDIIVCNKINEIIDKINGE